MAIMQQPNPGQGQTPGSSPETSNPLKNISGGVVDPDGLPRPEMPFNFNPDALLGVPPQKIIEGGCTQPNIGSTLNNQKIPTIQIGDSSVKEAFDALLKEAGAIGDIVLKREPSSAPQINPDPGQEPKLQQKITPEQMFRLIEKATKDADGQAAGQEFDDLRKVMKYLVDNGYQIEPKAMEIWNGYADKAGAIRLQGHSGIPAAEYDAMMKDLADKAGVRYDPVNQPFMGQEYGIDPKNAAFMEKMQQEGFGLKVGPDGKVLIEYKGVQMTSGIAQNDEKFEEKIISQLMELEKTLGTSESGVGQIQNSGWAGGPQDPYGGIPNIPGISRGGTLINEEGQLNPTPIPSLPQESGLFDPRKKTGV